MERKVEEKEKRVYEASITGSVSLLKQLMAKDPLTLAQAEVTCFNETPLHVAAMLGHLNFTKYLLTQKPDMTIVAEAKAETPSRDSRPKKKGETLMIAATLIVGMTFQVALNPPGRVWDEDKVVGAGEDNKKMLAGTSIMAHYYPEHYEMYMAYNSVSFFGSLCMVLLGVSGVPFVKRKILMWVLMIIMWIILTFIAATYSLSVLLISPSKDGISRSNKFPNINKVILVSAFVWWGVLGIIVFIHTIRFLLWCARKVGCYVGKLGKWVIRNCIV